MIVLDIILRQIKNQLNNWSEWESSKRIVLAVSGGVDSMVLLDLMLSLVNMQEYQDRQIIVAHFNHRLRDPEIHAIEENLVVETAKENNLIYFVSQWFNPATKNIEARARNSRYKFLADVCHATQADCLMTAHHMDDSVETMIMRLIRGASFKGLSGINPNYPRVMQASNGEVFTTQMMRPLIQIRKKDLYSYAQRNKVAYFEDETNHTLEYLRNRIRLQIIPLMEEENPRFFENLSLTLEQQQASYEVHHQDYMKIEPYLLQMLKEKWLLNVTEWQDLNAAERQIYLLIFFEERLIHTVNQYDKNLIKQLEDLIMNDDKPSGQLNLASGWVARREYDKIIISQAPARKLKRNGIQGRDLPQDTIEISSHNKWYSIGNGQWIGIFESSYINNQMLQSVSNYLPLDLSECKKVPHFRLRHRQTGDVMLLGHHNQSFHKKITRVMIDKKIPLIERELLWLLIDEEDDIIWLVNHLASLKYRPKNTHDASHYVFIQNSLN